MKRVDIISGSPRDWPWPTLGGETGQRPGKSVTGNSRDFPSLCISFITDFILRGASGQGHCVYHWCLLFNGKHDKDETF